jgi:hypothetical protein
MADWLAGAMKKLLQASRHLVMYDYYAGSNII